MDALTAKERRLAADWRRFQAEYAETCADFSLNGLVPMRLLGITNTSFASVPPLFIDPTLGNDDNDGLTAGAGALKSADEWCRRMDGQQITTGIVVQCAPGDVGNFQPLTIGENNQTASAFVLFQGSYSNSVQIGAISSTTPQNPATGQEFIFSDTSGVGPAIPDNSRLMIVSSATPANVGGTAYVKGFGGGGATNPYTTGWTTANGVAFFPSVGDTYAVSTPTTIARSFICSWINKFSTAPTAGGLAWQNFLVRTERLAAYLITSNEQFNNGNFSSYFIQCTFDDAAVTNFARCNFRTYGCEFRVPVGVNTTSVVFHSPCFRAGMSVTAAQVSLDAGPACFDGPNSFLNITNGGAVSNSTDMCFSRGVAGTPPGILVQVQGALHVTGQAWTPPVGARNGLTYGVVLYSGGVIVTNFFALIATMLGSSLNVSSEDLVEIVQFTVVENNQSAITDTSLGNGALMLLKEIATGAGGAIPAVSPTAGSERFSSQGGQYARSAGGSLGTVAPAGRLATKTHAQLNSYRDTGVGQTIGATTANILQVSIAAPAISGNIDNCAFYVEATFAGYDATGGAAVAAKVSRVFKRVAGALTALGAQAVISAIAGDAALLAATVTLNATGVALQMQATGVAGVTINWTACVEIWSTEFVG